MAIFSKPGYKSAGQIMLLGFWFSNLSGEREKSEGPPKTRQEEKN